VDLAHRSATKKLVTEKKETSKYSNNKKRYNIRDIILLPRNHIGITINNYKKANNIEPKVRNVNLSYHQRQRTII
jgi:hypothetical protein